MNHGDTYSRDGVICPYCEHTHYAYDDNYELYSEDTCEWDCHSCDRTFSVTVCIYYAWETGE